MRQLHVVAAAVQDHELQAQILLYGEPDGAGFHDVGSSPAETVGKFRQP